MVLLFVGACAALYGWLDVMGFFFSSTRVPFGRFCFSFGCLWGGLGLIGWQIVRALGAL
jgi:hypothetical protein